MALTDSISIVGIVVIGICSDGKCRRVQLTGKQPKQIYGFIKHIHGGVMTLEAEPFSTEPPARPEAMTL